MPIESFNSPASACRSRQSSIPGIALAFIEEGRLFFLSVESNLAIQSTVEDWRAGGRYSRLSEGVTHWRREGAADGVPVVLVHGATVPCWEFDSLLVDCCR